MFIHTADTTELSALVLPNGCPSSACLPNRTKGAAAARQELAIDSDEEYIPKKKTRLAEAGDDIDPSVKGDTTGSQEEQRPPRRSHHSTHNENPS